MLDVPAQHVNGYWMVLGAGGFIGNAVVEALMAWDYRVAAIHRNSPAIIKGESFQIHSVYDSSSLCELLLKLRPIVLINAIGHQATMDETVLRDFYRQTTTSILEAVRTAVPHCRVILLGSAAEYGNSPEQGSHESDSLRPLSPYAHAKAEQFELACRYNAQGTQVMTARIFNPIGPGQSERQFVSALMKRIHTGELPLQVHNANHLRDWIDIRDVANALITLAAAKNPPMVVNICAGKAHSVGSVAARVALLAGVEVKAIPGLASPTVLWRSIGNSERLRSSGWQPNYTLDKSLADQWRCGV